MRCEGRVWQSGLLGWARHTPSHAPISLVEGGHVQLGPVVRAPEPGDPGPLADGRPLVHPVRVFLHVFGQIGLLNRDKFRSFARINKYLLTPEPEKVLSSWCFVPKS